MLPHISITYSQALPGLACGKNATCVIITQLFVFDKQANYISYFTNLYKHNK